MIAPIVTVDAPVVTPASDAPVPPPRVVSAQTVRSAVPVVATAFNDVPGTRPRTVSVVASLVTATT